MALPTLRTQLDNKTGAGGVDCMVMTGVMGVEFATGGQFVPTPKQFRIWAGSPMKDGKPRGLTTRELRAALQKAQNEWMSRGNVAFDIRYYMPKSYSVAKVREDLRAGRFAGVLADYTVINREFPAASGQLTLNRGHALALFGLRKVDGVNRTMVYDPLFDGRKRGWGQAPAGPVDAPFPTFRRAMGYIGEGRFLGFTVGPWVPPTPEPEPEPPPPVHDWEALYKDLEVRFSMVSASQHALRTQVDVLEAARKVLIQQIDGLGDRLAEIAEIANG